MGTWCHLCRSDRKAIFMPYISKSRWSAAIAAHCSRRGHLNAVPDPAWWNSRQYRLCSGPCWPPTHCRHGDLPLCPQQLIIPIPSCPVSIALCFQPTAINSHPLKCSHHGGTQRSASFLTSAAPVTLCPLFATVQLCLCIVSFTASAASLETTAESTVPGIHQRCCAPSSHFFGTILPQSLLSRGPGGRAWQGQLDHGRARRCCCPALPSPQSGFTLKVTSLETRRGQEGRKRESPSLHPFPIAGKGGRPLILRAGLPGAQALPLPLAAAPARAEDPALPLSAITCRDPKAELGHRQTHFSRQTCSHLKAKFSFSISDTEHSSSGPHQRPFPSNPGEAGRKGALASTAIPDLSDTGAAARHHRLLIARMTGSKKSQGQAGDEVQDAGSPLEPGN